MQTNSRVHAASAPALLVTSLLAGCATDALSRAPARPGEPWAIASAAPQEARPPDSASATKPSTKSHARGENSPSNAIDVDEARHYELAELIDIAQRRHPETREAWEAARQAALRVGLSEHTFLPELSLEVVGGFQHTPLPIPKNLNPAGYFTSNTAEFVPILAVKWLLFDFGLRAGAVRVAKERSYIANVAFTGAHQRVVYSVSRDYFALGAARGRLRVAEQAVKNAEVAEDASTSRHAHGLATVVDVAHAKRQTARARFDVVRATGAEHAAYAALVASMGIETDASLAIADSSKRPLPPMPAGELDSFVDDALARRPDVIVALAKIRAAQESVDVARAKFYPKIGLTGQVYQNIGALSTEGSPYYTVYQPGGNIMFGLSWTIFDGGERSTHVELAKSELSAARASLDHARDRVVKEVTDAYDAVRTSFAEYEAALTLEQAAQTAYDAALDVYRHGVGNYTDLVSAETALSQAQFEKENAHANVFSSAAALAFATGNILSGRR